MIQLTLDATFIAGRLPPRGYELDAALHRPESGLNLLAFRDLVCDSCQPCINAYYRA